VTFIELGSYDGGQHIYYVKFTKVATAIGQARGEGVRRLMGTCGKMFSIYRVFSLVKITIIS
jgi:hypothetical protein